VSSLRGEKASFVLLSKNNSGMAALRAGLPVKTDEQEELGSGHGICESIRLLPAGVYGGRICGRVLSREGVVDSVTSLKIMKTGIKQMIVNETEMRSDEDWVDTVCTNVPCGMGIIHHKQKKAVLFSS